jgi:hypothetical protein
MEYRDRIQSTSQRILLLDLHEVLEGLAREVESDTIFQQFMNNLNLFNGSLDKLSDNLYTALRENDMIDEIR